MLSFDCKIYAQNDFSFECMFSIFYALCVIFSDIGTVTFFKNYDSFDIINI